MTESQTPLLTMRGIGKSFGAKSALSGVDLTVGAGEIHGLLGGNGAGKTTLMNILFGLYRRDAGSIELDGRALDIRSPKEAIAAGIGMVHQTFLQVDNHTALENIVAGTRQHAGSGRPGSAQAQVLAAMETSGLEVDLNAKVRDLPMGERQRIEILKALYRRARLLILDEPTTNLTAEETARLFEASRRMADGGMAVIVITHKIHDAVQLCDRASVMNSGTMVRTTPMSDTSPRELIELMIPVGADSESRLAIDAFLGGEESEDGEERETDDATREATPGGTSAAQPILSAGGLVVGSPPAVKGVDLDLRPGRVLGIAGVAGNGQRQLLEALAGVLVPAAGEVRVAGRPMTGRPTSSWLEAGVAYVAEDRHRDGILPGRGLTQNYLLGHHGSGELSSHGWISWRRVRERTRAAVERFAIATPDISTPLANLSGGNIQRLILARAFAHDPKVLLMHNPTRGLDIPSVVFVYERIRDAARHGTAVVVASDDLDELFHVSDEICVVFSGAIVARWPRAEFDRTAIEHAMAGDVAAEVIA